MSRSHPQRAFTLIELLVVISIIALLIALLLPALGQTRIVTHATVCKSNLHQVLMGIYGYASDNNNYAPPWEFSSSAGLLLWTNPKAQFVKDYMGGSEGALQDPSVGPPYEWLNGVGMTSGYTRVGTNPSTNRFSDWPRWPDASGGGFATGGGFYDYALSEEYCSIPSDPSFYTPRPPLDKHMGDVTTNPLVVGRLSGTPSAQSHIVWCNRYNGPIASEASDSYINGQDSKAPRHMDGTVANVGYVDGHVAGFHSLAAGNWPATVPH